TAVYFTDEKNGWAVGHDNKILATQDGGTHWTLQYKSENLDESQPYLDVWFKDKNHGFVVGAYGGFMHTEDGGKTWEDWTDHIDNEDQLHFNGISGRADGTMFIVGEQGMLFRSNDSGETWKKLNSPYEGSLFSVLAAKKTGVVYVCGLQGHIFKSTNNGDSWEKIKTGISAGLMAANQLDDGAILITGNAGNVLRAADENAPLSLITRPDRQAVMGIVSTRSPWVVAVGEGGVKLLSADGSSPETH
ncbi:MAG TPA: YCF48-related protein, partial [Pseudomonadales bacterium]|nr:YCF48-related protein [Pseudomonadales bacterium]